MSDHVAGYVRIHPELLLYWWGGVLEECCEIEVA